MTINAIYRLIKKWLLARITLRGFFLPLMGVGLLLLGVAYADSAMDPLAETIKPQIQATFGKGSTVMFAVYIGEVLTGAITYIKSKNLLCLLGTVILILFTTAMFALIGK